MARFRITICLALFGAAAVQTLAAQPGGSAPAGENRPAAERFASHPYKSALGALANYRSCGVRVRAARYNALATALRSIESLAEAKGLAPTLSRLRQDYYDLLAVSTMAACGGGPAAASARARRAIADFRAWAAGQPDFAQAPRVPVPISGGESDGYPACSTATIMNLDRADAFLAVRAGPSARERELARLRNGDAVFACVRRGNWFGIVFAPPGRGTGCDVDRARRAARAYAGPCRSGWVHYNYIGGYADWVSP
ncbi:MAG: hypothetical protein QOD42_1800 [Sphingomonadales bacterium]|jgi:hypothetical protein|nr:hypothetical protein [Sphingomonadales bacterium]